MARKSVHRALPELAALHPGFDGFPAGETILASLTRLLRATARRVRRGGPSAFYSHRQLANFFRVPLRTVHLACRQLAMEGLLICVRGSATFVPGRRRRPASPPCGVVGLPIWTHGFVLLPHWRSFFIRLEEDLRRHGFVADAVHYDASSATGMELADRLLAHRIDAFVWLYPLESARQAIEQLADSGVRGYAVVHAHISCPRLTQFRTEWEPAYVEALGAWRRDGINEVVVVANPKPPSLHTAAVHRALARIGLPARDWCGSNVDEIAVVEDRVGVLFPDDLRLSALASSDHAALARLLGRARVLVANPIPLEGVPADARVDIVRVDWPRLARRIARTLAMPDTPSSKRDAVIRAHWLPRLPARECLA